MVAMLQGKSSPSDNADMMNQEENETPEDEASETPEEQEMEDKLGLEQHRRAKLFGTLNMVSTS